jgi:hypothetical protein
MPRHSYRERDSTSGQAMLKLRASIGLTQAGLAPRLGVYTVLFFREAAWQGHRRVGTGAVWMRGGSLAPPVSPTLPLQKPTV